MIENIEWRDQHNLWYDPKDEWNKNPTKVICKKLNEVIDVINRTNTPLPTPIWKIGDKSWYVNVFESGCSNDWVVESADMDDFLLEQFNKGDLNIFKTKKQAEQALAEIKEVMRRYQ